MEGFSIGCLEKRKQPKISDEELVVGSDDLVFVDSVVLFVGFSVHVVVLVGLFVAVPVGSVGLLVGYTNVMFFWWVPVARVHQKVPFPCEAAFRDHFSTI